MNMTRTPWPRTIEDDAKRLEKAEKAAILKAAKRKRPIGNQRNSWTRQPRSAEPAAGPSRKVPMPQPTYGQPRQRIPGPCFNCLEMGHLKATCPKLIKQYPFVQKAREPSHYVCDMYKESESKLVLKSVDEHKDPNKGMV